MKFFMKFALTFTILQMVKWRPRVVDQQAQGQPGNTQQSPDPIRPTAGMEFSSVGVHKWFSTPATLTVYQKHPEQEKQARGRAPGMRSGCA